VDLPLAVISSTSCRASLGNVHFEDRLEQGEIIFKCQIKLGVLRFTNDRALIRAVSLQV
jgi:hypothetical protein